MVENLNEKLNNLPNEPGVYVMLSESGEIIYIGKARILKNRVRQYFRSPKNLTTKVIAMVSKIKDFYYIITKTESDALMLEANLIKKHKPQYNILLKDDKSYPYIKINKKQAFPKVEITRKLKKDGANYFGPYFGGISVRDIENIINEGFHLRSCNVNFDKIPKNHRPCINCQIHRCDAPCIGRVTAEQYNLRIDDVVKFLKGDTEKITALLTEKMQASAENEMFERAIEMRNLLKIVDKIKEKKLTALPKNVDIDIFTIETDGINRVVNQLIIRQGRMQGGQNYNIIDCISEVEDVLASFIVQYYANSTLPDEIIVSLSEESTTSLYEALSSVSEKRFNLISPKMGMRKGLLEMSSGNARDYLEKSIDKLKAKGDMTVGATELLAKYLNLPTVKRMECYDISNVSGVDKVASMVVFINGESSKADYRRFKINTVEGANDFASMKEVLTRRLKRLVDDETTDNSFKSRPDLLVIDGGPIQLRFAREAMEDVGVDIPIISLAKREEEIYVPYQDAPIIISKRDNALKMLMRIRDESHRFAITYFRSLHNKNALVSQLDNIDGIGESKKNALNTHFKTVKAIKQASIKELMQVDGIGKMLANTIYEHFNK